MFLDLFVLLQQYECLLDFQLGVWLVVCGLITNNILDGVSWLVCITVIVQLWLDNNNHSFTTLVIVSGGSMNQIIIRLPEQE